MIKLEELASILSTNENLEVSLTENGLLISDKQNEDKIIPTDLVNFVKVYEREPNISRVGNGFLIYTTEFTAQSFMMLLMSVFAAEYDFEVKGAYQLSATPKSIESVKDLRIAKEPEAIDTLESLETLELDFEKIAEAIDAEGIEIEIHEDGLVVKCENKTRIAEAIEAINPNLVIEITDEHILVGE